MQTPVIALQGAPEPRPRPAKGEIEAQQGEAAQGALGSCMVLGRSHNRSLSLANQSRSLSPPSGGWDGAGFQCWSLPPLPEILNPASRLLPPSTTAPASRLRAGELVRPAKLSSQHFPEPTQHIKNIIKQCQRPARLPEPIR